MYSSITSATPCQNKWTSCDCTASTSLTCSPNLFCIAFTMGNITWEESLQKHIVYTYRSHYKCKLCSSILLPSPSKCPDLPKFLSPTKCLISEFNAEIILNYHIYHVIIVDSLLFHFSIIRGGICKITHFLGKHILVSKDTYKLCKLSSSTYASHRHHYPL